MIVVVTYYAQEIYLNSEHMVHNIPGKKYFYPVDYEPALRWPYCVTIIGCNFVWKSKLQLPDTGTRVLDNTRPFLHSSIVSFWITPARSKECKYHILRCSDRASGIPWDSKPIAAKSVQDQPPFWSHVHAITTTKFYQNFAENNVISDEQILLSETVNYQDRDVRKQQKER